MQAMVQINRRTLLAGLAAPFVHTPSRTARRRINVVKFMTDDHGAWALGAYGCTEMRTPNLDALAAAGARFDRAYACTPVCSPSRLTYMTGRLPSTHGVQDWLMPPDSFGAGSRHWLRGHTTYAEVLASAGYTLGMCGKWHMGRDEEAQFGFSYWASVPGGGGSYKDPEFVKNGTRSRIPGFKTDIVGDCALEFLERQRGKSQPFYLLVPFYAPHTPYDFQPEEYRTPYARSGFSCFPRTEMHRSQNKGLASHHDNIESMRSYSALVTAADANVGRVLRRLEEMGVRGDTLVIFTADQGYNTGHHGVWGKGNGTWPFNMYEESVRVPLIWNHPGRIRAGQLVRPLVSSYDFFPSILEYLGVRAKPDARRVGASYAGLLLGGPPPPRGRLYFEYSYVRAVRTENLKLIVRTKEWPGEFYDLEVDPGETANLINHPARQEQIASLRADLERFFAGAGAPPLDQWRSTTSQQLQTYESVGLQ